MGYSFKQKTGAVLYDLPQFLWSMRPSFLTRSETAPWVFFCNRNELLVRSRSGLGVMCNWRWTSELYLPKVFPRTGRLLMMRAFESWPINLVNERQRDRSRVQVSFIIGHRGISRWPLLKATINSIAAQHDVDFECIVVEQSTLPEIKDFLPPWIRYIHTALPQPDMPYSRSWAFNVGARQAHGKV